MAKMSFNDLINSEIPVLIDFTASWCGPCKMQSPILDEVAKKVGDKARIVKIDIDANEQLAGSMGVRSVPTLTLFKKGEELWRQSGVQSAHTLINIIEANQ